MKEAKLYYTKQGYSYIKCKKEDCLDWGGFGICDFCGEEMTDEVYLIFILNSAYCEKCFKEWINRARAYEEDLAIQKQNHISYYRAYGFNIKED